MADEDDIFGEAFDVFEKASGGVSTSGEKSSKKTDFSDDSDIEKGSDEDDADIEMYVKF